jgi:hypothetical protein
MGCFAALLRGDSGILGRHGDLFGNGPHKGDEFPGDGHHDLIGVLPPYAQLAVASAQPHVGFPTDILNRFRQRSEASLEMAADLGRVAGGPGTFDECMSRLGVPRLSDRALTPPLTTGVF